MTRISKTILVGRDGFAYLRNRQRVERGSKPLNYASIDNCWDRLRKYRKIMNDGKDIAVGEEMVLCNDDSFGGGDGTADGMWWGWSVDTLKQMLECVGIAYEIGPDEEIIDA